MQQHIETNSFSRIYCEMTRVLIPKNHLKKNRHEHFLIEIRRMLLQNWTEYSLQYDCSIDTKDRLKHKLCMEFEVLVQLKGEVLDPEGRAIEETLKAQGIHGVSEVEVAKRYVLRVDLEPSKAEAVVKDIAERYLANPVAQTYSIKRL